MSVYSKNADPSTPALLVRVSGSRGSGVTTVAREIAQALANAGFNVGHSDGEGSLWKVHAFPQDRHGGRELDGRLIAVEEENFE